MKQLVEIDTGTKIGKSIASLLQTLSTENKSIHFLTDKELEAKEDMVLATMIKNGIKSGKASKKTLFKTLGIE
ncbi:MAG TPA: hypothetical protein PL009_00600 [Flavipsychrobacter sp.]|nr:hypothetical protein [Flavipsychrobacter sp.]